jgi:hypothetical protein
MKKTTTALLGFGVVLVLGGALGLSFGTGTNANETIKQDATSIIQMNRGNDDSYGGMMGNIYNSLIGDTYSDTKKLDNTVLSDRVIDYINKFEEDLVIADIFIFGDTDYYYSIVEKTTGMGAMELLVNPYTGIVYQEYGPNMMWNLKYGMMSSQNMMGYGGMMGGQYRTEQRRDDYNNNNYTSNGEVEANELSVDEALSLGNEFLSGQKGDYSLSDSYHEFYGYYTFHIENQGEASGMLSVNAFTGEVWFHNWHGNLIEIVGSHEDGE